MGAKRDINRPLKKSILRTRAPSHTPLVLHHQKRCPVRPVMVESSGFCEAVVTCPAVFNAGVMMQPIPIAAATPATGQGSGSDPISQHLPDKRPEDGAGARALQPRRKPGIYIGASSTSSELCNASAPRVWRSLACVVCKTGKTSLRSDICVRLDLAQIAALHLLRRLATLSA